MAVDHTSGQPLRVRSLDGYPLGVTLFAAPQPRAVLLVNTAVGISQRYYRPFAQYMAQHHFTTITYDYRGVGKSAPPRLTVDFAGGFRQLVTDTECLMQYAQSQCPGLPLGLIGHSIGGILPLLTPENRKLDAMFTVGTQMAYPPDFGPGWWDNVKLRFQWFMLMPLLTRCYGYFPGERLKLGFADIPAQFVHEIAMRRHYENIFDFLAELNLPSHHLNLICPTLAFSATDDPLCTPMAMTRLYSQLANAPVQYQRLNPADIGADSIGHTRFFRRDLGRVLWPMAANWFTRQLVAPT
ncbi:alpha/beta hydrolase family protein [Fibrella aquatilis]|uniref:Alpha/beta fold hydrolase n=1 Tax=Fibrella aquatilis TaxID=2817059 RepID=A0A939K0U3_9BACT|nr:alpha/beta fold hydrolase [Fibrella aquatilis]MBO0934554.1 alpha/beta fold hydrolase [Fibrella aquatilis]